MPPASCKEPVKDLEIGPRNKDPICIDSERESNDKQASNQVVIGPPPKNNSENQDLICGDSKDEPNDNQDSFLQDVAPNNVGQ